MSLSYTQLVAAVQDYVENTFSTTDINTIIREAEQRIYNSVQIPALRKNVLGSLTSGNKYLQLPTDWLATFSLAVIDGTGVYNYLLNKDVNFIRESYPTAADTGVPAHYAQFDKDSLILGPMPDSAYQVELHYFYYPESITTAGSSWLGDNFESALLYGCLLAANTFMKGEPDVQQMYQQRYEEAMMLLKQLGDGKDRQDAYRSGQVRYPVK